MCRKFLNHGRKENWTDQKRFSSYLKCFKVIGTTCAQLYIHTCCLYFTLLQGELPDEGITSSELIDICSYACDWEKLLFLGWVSFQASSFTIIYFYKVESKSLQVLNLNSDLTKPEKYSSMKSWFWKHNPLDDLISEMLYFVSGLSWIDSISLTHLAFVFGFLLNVFCFS